VAGIFDVGSIAPPGADFASTGPHLHFGVQDAAGKYLNPETARSFLLSRLLVGKDKTPLYSQKGSEWVGAFPVTSKFGPRSAPTAGASSEHMGMDLGIPQGTQLAWSANPGDAYTPNKGYGSIKTTDTKGNPYTVKLLHTLPGAASQLPGQAVASDSLANVSTTPTNSKDVFNIYIGKKKTDESDLASDNFLSNYLSSMLSNSAQQNSNQMISALTKAANQTTEYG
jgi:hypothetical protein